MGLVKLILYIFFVEGCVEEGYYSARVISRVRLINLGS